MLIYITEHLWYAVIEREEAATGWFYYTVKEVTPRQSQEEWPVVAVERGRMSRKRAILIADECDRSTEIS